MGNFKFGKRSKTYLNKEGVQDITVKLCKRALKESSIDFGIIDSYRTYEEQAKMYEEGKSELDGINKMSDHQYGLAVDVIPVIKIDGKKYNPFDVHYDVVKLAWFELYRGFMRAAMKLGIHLEFGYCYNIGGGRDWPHISIKQ